MEITGSWDPNALIRHGHAMVRAPEDAGLYVEFYERDIYQPAATEKARKLALDKGEDPEKVEPIFAKEIYCKIEPAGDLEKWDQPARPQDKARFAREWQLYLNGNKEFGGGTSLTDLKDVAEDQIKDLRNMGVYSIEQLAATSDAVLGNLGLGAREMRDRARKWILDKEKVAPYETIKAEKEALEMRLAALEAKFAINERPKQEILAHEKSKSESPMPKKEK